MIYGTFDDWLWLIIDLIIWWHFYNYYKHDKTIQKKIKNEVES